MGINYKDLSVEINEISPFPTFERMRFLAEKKGYLYTVASNRKKVTELLLISFNIKE